MKNPKLFEFFTLITALFLLTIVVGTVMADNPPSTPTNISLSLSANSVKLGDSLVVSGAVTPSQSGFSPVSNVSVTLTLTKPDATASTTTVTTGSDGSFSATYTPDASGNWQVEASWEGDVSYLGATSSAEPFSVTNTSSSSGGGASIPVMDFYIIGAVVAVVIIVVIVGLLFFRRKSSAKQAQ
jgi:hypothetical protein